LLNSKRVLSRSFIGRTDDRVRRFGVISALTCRLTSSALLCAIALVFAGCGSETKPPVTEPKTTSPSPVALTVKSTPDPKGSQTVTIAAASDLKFALDEVIAAFNRQHPEITCKVTTGSSGNFFAQLSNKAPFDLYLSADIDYPRKLVEQGLAIRETEFQYAIGHLVAWVPRDSLLKLEEAGIETLSDPSVSKIAVANPKHAPYGRAAIAALKSLGVYDQVEPRLVMAENIAQTAQFVETGAADIGLISLSLALSPALQDKGRYWALPASTYPAIVQGGVILNWVQDRAAAEQVRDYLLSNEGRAILRKYGFADPTP